MWKENFKNTLIRSGPQNRNREPPEKIIICFKTGLHTTYPKSQKNKKTEWNGRINKEREKERHINEEEFNFKILLYLTRCEEIQSRR